MCTKDDVNLRLRGGFEAGDKVDEVNPPAKDLDRLAEGLRRNTPAVLFEFLGDIASRIPEGN